MAPDDKHDWARSDGMTDAEREAAVRADPDAVVLTDDDLAPFKRVARSEWLRHRLHLSREEFAEAYGIPLATLVAWRRHEAEPSAVERAYLAVIERDPDGVRAALAREPVPAG